MNALAGIKRVDWFRVEPRAANQAFNIGIFDNPRRHKIISRMTH